MRRGSAPSAGQPPTGRRGGQRGGPRGAPRRGGAARHDARGQRPFDPTQRQHQEAACGRLGGGGTAPALPPETSATPAGGRRGPGKDLGSASALHPAPGLRSATNKPEAQYRAGERHSTGTPSCRGPWPSREASRPAATTAPGARLRQRDRAQQPRAVAGARAGAQATATAPRHHSDAQPLPDDGPPPASALHSAPDLRRATSAPEGQRRAEERHSTG